MYENNIKSGNTPVITGIGLITPFCDNKEDFILFMRKGEKGVKEFCGISEENGNINFLFTNKFDIKKYISSIKLYLDKHSAFLLSACKLAFDDAGISEKELINAALCIGTAYGCTDTIEKFYTDIRQKGMRFAKPILFPHTYLNTSVSLCAIEFGLKGIQMNFCSGNEASSDALLYAADLIKYGYTEIAIAGGCDTLSRLLQNYFLQHKKINSDKKLYIAESAGIIILESKEKAESRNAFVYAEFSSESIAMPKNDNENSGILETINFMGVSGIIRTIISCL